VGDTPQLVFVEEAFCTLKGFLIIRPVYHQEPERIEAHLFVAFMANRVSTMLRQHMRGLASGLMPRVVLEKKLATVQVLDVRVPTTDGRELLLIRRTEPAADVALVQQQLELTPAAQNPYPGCDETGRADPTFQTPHQRINGSRTLRHPGGEVGLAQSSDVLNPFQWQFLSETSLPFWRWAPVCGSLRTLIMPRIPHMFTI
jgi:hypothetical protein